MDDSRLRQPAMKAANWWRIAQHEARVAVLKRLALPETLAATPWAQLSQTARESIAQETVGQDRQ